MSGVIPVILCGGSGTRLWPLSRSDRPKQFINLTGNHTLLEGTLLRAAKIVGAGDPICVTSTNHAAEVRNSLDRMGMAGRLLLEPCARGTAPALCAAALVAMRGNPQAILVALPADHFIEDDDGFSLSIASACKASQAHIVVLGVVPRSAAAGFGYIVPGASLAGVAQAAHVSEFIEKPSETDARTLIERGALWNAGIVVARASILLQAFKRFAPEVLAAVENSLEAGIGGETEVQLAAGSFSAAPSISFDTSVLEKSSAVAVVQLAAKWRDVGTWDAVAELFSGDPAGNRACGQVRLSVSTDTFVMSPHRLTVGLGLKDLIVIDTRDALLIADRHNLGGLRDVVAKLTDDQIAGWPTKEVQARSGQNDGVIKGVETQLIVLDAKQRDIQVQTQEFPRHWIVLEGTAEVTIDKNTFSYRAHQSFYVGPGHACELSNSEALPAKLLEVRIRDKFDD